MTRYLVVAHQTASSLTLVSRLAEMSAADLGASFTLVVPTTNPSELLDPTSGDARAIAEAAASRAIKLLESRPERSGPGPTDELDFRPPRRVHRCDRVPRMRGREVGRADLRGPSHTEAAPSPYRRFRTCRLISSAQRRESGPTNS